MSFFNTARIISLHINQIVCSPCLGACQYLSMSFFMDATSLFLWYFLKLPTAANYRFPYASTSPADFWNKRWNLPVSHAMRALIYDPFLEGKLIKLPAKEKEEEERDAIGKKKKTPSSALSSADKNKNKNNNSRLLRRVIGVLLVFSVSGIIHEIMYLYMTGHFTRNGIWMRYFFYWGVIVVLEGVMKQAVRRAGVKIPTWISWIVTMFLCELDVSYS